jgi:hypothetical protein
MLADKMTSIVCRLAPPIKGAEMKSYEEIERREDAAVQAFRGFLSAHADALALLWNWGDGDGGYVINEMRRALQDGQRIQTPYEKPLPKKAVIPQRLRKQVFERDAYRCCMCGTHVDLCVDHIYPESRGGTADLANLQTLCRPCNSAKGASIPK